MYIPIVDVSGLRNKLKWVLHYVFPKIEKIDEYHKLYIPHSGNRLTPIPIPTLTLTLSANISYSPLPLSLPPTVAVLVVSHVRAAAGGKAIFFWCTPTVRSLGFPPAFFFVLSLAAQQQKINTRDPRTAHNACAWMHVQAVTHGTPHTPRLFGQKYKTDGLYWEKGKGKAANGRVQRARGSRVQVAPLPLPTATAHKPRDPHWIYRPHWPHWLQWWGVSGDLTSFTVWWKVWQIPPSGCGIVCNIDEKKKLWLYITLQVVEFLIHSFTSLEPFSVLPNVMSAVEEEKKVVIPSVQVCILLSFIYKCHQFCDYTKKRLKGTLKFALDQWTVIANRRVPTVAAATMECGDECALLCQPIWQDNQRRLCLQHTSLDSAYST